MYIEKLELENVRTFTGGKAIEFVHPDMAFRREKKKKGANAKSDEDHLPAPKLRNVTLLPGDNGSGKSTILRAVAAAACAGHD